MAEMSSDESWRTLPVPGTVQLVTSEPIPIPRAAVTGQSVWREALEERPWLLAVGVLTVLGGFLLARRVSSR